MPLTIVLLLLVLLCRGSAFIFPWLSNRMGSPQQLRRLSAATENIPAAGGAPTAAAASAAAKDTFKFKIRELFWVTPEALNMEVLISRGKEQFVKPRRPKDTQPWTWGNFLFKIVRLLGRGLGERPQLVRRPPLLFVHGSFHSAWCFSENYMEYFSRLGHDCFAISLRGTAATSMPPENPGDTVRIEQHLYDVTFALNVIRKFYEDEGLPDMPAPVVVAHSFGGMIAMKLLESRKIREAVSGVALLCSVPPSGNAPMTQRFVKRDFLAAMRIVWGFVLKGATFNPSTCKELFFDSTVPKEDINRCRSKPPSIREI